MSRRRIGSACSAASFAVLVGLLSLVLGASPALAYWSSTGAGTGSGQTGTLAPPTDVTVSENAVTDVVVSWTAATGGVTPEGYVVTRYLNATASPACASSPTTLLTGTLCTDEDVPDGAYTYVVTSMFRSWTAPSAASPTVTVVSAAKLGFLAEPTDAAARVAVNPPVVVRLLSAAGDPVALAGVPITLAIGTNPSAGSLAGTTTVSTLADGTATLPNLSIDRAGVGYTLVATSPDLTSATSAAFTVLPPPPLGDASSYSVLGGTGVVNTLASTVSGDLGTGTGSDATGFPPGIVAGDIHEHDADSAGALADASEAYTAMRALTPAEALPGDLGGQTRGPGVYSTGAALAVTGILTLDAQGDPNATFVFKVNAALNMGATGQIKLINGAQAANVYWVINGAVTIGANSFFKGTILADGAITLGDSTELIGRAFATGTVTMANNTIRFTPELPPTLTITNGAVLVTKDTTPDISGTTNAPVGTTVKVAVGGQVLSTTVQTGGGWTVTAAPLMAGSYDVVAQVRDAAGNATKVIERLSVEVNPDPVDLGSAASFSVLTNGNVNNGGSTHLSGDLGREGLVSLLVGFPPTVDGQSYWNNTITEAAQGDLLRAMNDAAGRREHTQFAGNLGGRTFHVGIHESAAAVGLTGAVTLDGEGDPNAVFIFQINGAMTAAAGCQVNLVNEAQAANVFWVVDGAASIGASCALAGNIMTRGAITLGDSTSLAGRALSRAAITMDTNEVIGATPRAAARVGSARSRTSGESSAPTPSSSPTPSSESSPSVEPTSSEEPVPSTEPSPSSTPTAASHPPTKSASPTTPTPTTPTPTPSGVSSDGAP